MFFQLNGVSYFCTLCHFIVLGWYSAIRVNSLYSQFHPHSPTIWNFSNSPENETVTLSEKLSAKLKSVRFASNSYVSPSLCVTESWLHITITQRTSKIPSPGPISRDSNSAALGWGLNMSQVIDLQVMLTQPGLRSVAEIFAYIPFLLFFFFFPTCLSWD